jgi:hypothetical protein
MAKTDKSSSARLRRRGHTVRGAVGILALALGASAPVGAALYKWVDANGRVSYSDQPPPGNAKSELVALPVAPANPDAVKEMANQAADLKKRQTQRDDDVKKAEKARADADQQRVSCAEVRSQIKLYQSATLLSTVNEKGEPVYMDDSMKNRERQRLESMARERCQG